jgi:hypothetical protein
MCKKFHESTSNNDHVLMIDPKDKKKAEIFFSNFNHLISPYKRRIKEEEDSNPFQPEFKFKRTSNKDTLNEKEQKEINYCFTGNKQIDLNSLKTLCCKRNLKIDFNDLQYYLFCDEARCKTYYYYSFCQKKFVFKRFFKHHITSGCISTLKDYN